MKTYLLFFLFISAVFIGCKKEGCTYPEATNYDLDAELDDGTCDFPVTEEEEEISALAIWTGNYNVTQTESAENSSVTTNSSYSISITEIDENTVLIQNLLECFELTANITSTSMVVVGLYPCPINQTSMSLTSSGFTFTAEQDAMSLIEIVGEAIKQ